MSTALDNLYLAARRSIAGSASFQAWVGLEDEAAALARVYEIQAPADTPMPFAIVDRGEVEREDGQFVGGTMLMCFQSDPVDASVPIALKAHDAQVFKITEEMDALTGRAGYFDYAEMRIDPSILASEVMKKVDKDFIQTHIDIEW